MNRLTLLVLLFLVIASCNDADTKTAALQPSADSVAAVQARFVQPPLKGVDVPYEAFSFLADQGDTLFPTSGSILCFPGGSIVDKDGQAVKGKIDITYREFKDPLDFFLSGIPMEYEQNGVKYIFESSAMCELKATQNGVSVFVNPKNKPMVHLATRNADTAHNLYALDTVLKQWVTKGKDEITDLKKKEKAAMGGSMPRFASYKNSTAFSAARITPLKASGERPVIAIDIAPGSVPELMNYNNLKFEIAEEDKNWDPKYSDEEWTDVELEQTKKPGLYLASFSKPNQQVSFLVRPVLEGKEYDEAVKAFEAKKKESKNLKTARLSEEQKAKRQSAREEKRQLHAAKAQFEKETKEFEASEAVIRAKNKRIGELNALIIKRKQEKEINQQNAIATETIFRSFELERFGVWNCDEPVLREAFPLFARFKDKAGKEIRLTHVAVVYKNINGVSWYTNWNIMIMPDMDHLIWGVYEDKLAVLSYADFKKAGIKKDMTEYTFTMELMDVKDGYKGLKRML